MMASIAATLMTAPSTAAVCIVTTPVSSRVIPTLSRTAARMTRRRCPGCQESGELGVLRQVAFDLVELALFVFG